MTDKIENLDQVKATLYESFNKVIGYYGVPCGAESASAIGTLAQALVAVEREQREAKGFGYARLDKSKP